MSKSPLTKVHGGSQSPYDSAQKQKDSLLAEVRVKNPPCIFLFTGRKGAGKSAAAEFFTGAIKARGQECVRIDFADSLRDVVCAAFGLPRELTETPATKELPLEDWPYESPRKLLQTVGTDLFRAKWPDIWARAWQRKARIALANGQCVVTTDCRFGNEAEAAMSLAEPLFMRVERPQTGQDTHASETSHYDIPVDFIVENCGSLADLGGSILKIIELTIPQNPKKPHTEQLFT